MILYHQASDSLKLAFLQYLQNFLSNRELQNHFGIAFSPEGALRIIPQVYHPEAILQLEALLDYLQNTNLVNYVRETIGPHTGNLPPLRVTQINPHFESLLKQLKAPNPPAVSSPNTAPPYAADSHTPFYYPQAVPQPISSPSYTQAPPAHQVPPPFLTPSAVNGLPSSPAPMSQLETSAQIKSLELKIALLERHRWKNPFFHEMVNYNNAIIIDGECFVPMDARATPRDALEKHLQASGLQKLNSNNSFGYSEFRTPALRIAPPQPVSRPDAISTQSPYVSPSPGSSAANTTNKPEVMPTPMPHAVRMPPQAAPTPQPVPPVKIKSEQLKTLLLQQHRWKNPFFHEMVNYNNAIIIDGECFVPMDARATPRDALEKHLQASGLQKLNSNNSFGYSEFRTPSPGSAMQSPISTSSASRTPVPSAPPLSQSQISPMVNSPSIQPTPIPQATAQTGISIEAMLRQHHWRKPLPNEDIDYNNAILIGEEFFIPIPPDASDRDIIKTILVSLHGCQQLDSGSFGYPEFKRPSHPSTTPVQAVPSPTSGNSQIFFAPNRVAVVSQPPIFASTSSAPAASLTNPAPEFSPPSSGSSAASLAPPTTPLVRRSLPPQPISPAETAMIKGRLDPLIKQHWDEFSEPLRQHILQCNRGNLQSKFDMMQTVKFSDTLVSPIGFGLVRNIPVRLPSSDTAENKKYYNLIELLQLPNRIDPCASQPFSLQDIRPAPEALRELKNHIPAVSPQTGPRKGTSSH